MRKWHRWVSIFFGIFILWMAFTGVASHVAAIYANGGLTEGDGRRAPPPGAVKPATSDAPQTVAGVPTGNPGVQGQRPRDPKRAWVGFFHHLHSGETFGPVGTVISLLSGVSLLFFAFSGLWMYVEMFRRRGKADKKGLFWN